MARKLFRIVVILALLVFTLWAFSATEFDPVRIYDGFIEKDTFREFIQGLWPQNWGIFGEVAYQTMVTIQIAWIGTLFASIVALPLSFAAARTIAPTVSLGALLRFLFNTNRSVHMLIVALIMVTVVGLGPLAGMLAVALHSIGSLGKLFTEAIEGVDRGPIEALESVGATRMQVVRWGVFPQAVPYLISYFFYSFEQNIRSAVVLGFVGAGGIGFLLLDYMRQFQYHNVSIILVVIVILVMAMDYLSGRLRRAAA